MKMYSDFLADCIEKFLKKKNIVYEFEKNLGYIRFRFGFTQYRVFLSKKQISFRVNLLPLKEKNLAHMDSLESPAVTKEVDSKPIKNLQELVSKLNSDDLCCPTRGRLSFDEELNVVELAGAEIKIIGDNFPQKEEMIKELEEMLEDISHVFDLYGQVFFDVMWKKIEDADVAFHRCRQKFKEDQRHSLDARGDDFEIEIAKIWGIYDDEPGL